MLISRTAATGFIAMLALATLGGCPAIGPIDNSNSASNPSDGPSQDDINQSLTSEPPVANAGEDQTVVSDDVVVLNGLTSSDPQSSRLFFVWNQVDGPAVTFDTSTFQSITRFRAPVVSSATTLSFTLTVGNGYRASVDTVVITVNPAP